MKKFKTVTGKTTEEFDEAVNKEMENGYIPHGNCTILMFQIQNQMQNRVEIHYKFYQPMVLGN